MIQFSDAQALPPLTISENYKGFKLQTRYHTQSHDQRTLMLLLFESKYSNRAVNTMLETSGLLSYYNIRYDYQVHIILFMHYGLAQYPHPLCEVY